MTITPHSTDAQVLETMVDLWLQQPRLARAQLKDDGALAIQCAATGAYYLAADASWPRSVGFARMLLAERETLARAYFQVQFLERMLGQRLNSLLASPRLSKTDVLRALEICACHNAADAVRLLTLIEEHGSFLDRTRARISREAAEKYRAANRRQAPTQTQYPDLIPPEQFRDFTKLNS